MYLIFSLATILTQQIFAFNYMSCYNSNDKNKNDFLNDVDNCLKRNEIDPDVLFIALIESARDVCRVINEDFDDYLNRCIRFGSVDDYCKSEVTND